jgi:hypothetical protein
MSRLLVCNSFFELELSSNTQQNLLNWVNTNPMSRFLQFLPLLYKEETDLVLVSSLPIERKAECLLIDSIDSKKSRFQEIISWAPSKAIADFASEYGLIYKIPSFSLVKELQSKDYSHRVCPIEGAELIYNLDDYYRWISKYKGKKVVKKLLDCSGRGHLFESNESKLFSEMQNEFKAGRAVIGQPWLERKIDFSSQWEIGSTVELLGLTKFETSARGSYISTVVGEKWQENIKKQVEEHLRIAFPVLEGIKKRGFFGPVGVDAFIDIHDQIIPIIEINVRKTMSRVALDLHKKIGKGRTLILKIVNSKNGLLPSVGSKNFAIEFVH